MIAENLAEVRTGIRTACLASGRTPDSVRLVAVSKAFGIERIVEAYRAGQPDFGENYVQELREKRSTHPDSHLRWHFIGHLQSNKVKYLVDYVHLIHTVDDLDLAREIQKRAGRIQRTVDVLIEVHTTSEKTKSGVAPEKAVELATLVSGLKNVRVRGLMTMGPLAEDPEEARPSYTQLRNLLEEGKRVGLAWSELSMGMSHDYAIAIQEGATIVRIGTAIFGERNSSL